MRNIGGCALLFLLFTHFSYAQNKTAFVGPNTPVGYEKLGAVKGLAGIIGDNYYVIENDYGTRFDMNNNIKSSIAIFSIATGKLKKRVALNEMVANSNKDINKILFADIVTWKGRLVGFYTFKSATAKTFQANALICDEEGQLIKNVELGDFEYDYKGPEGGFINGRQRLSVVKSLHTVFTPDSSRLAVLTAPPNSKTGNIRFRVFKPGLELDKEVVAKLPLDKKEGQLVNFIMDNQGMIYALGQTEKSKSEKKESNGADNSYFFYSINTARDNEVKTAVLELPGKAIETVNIGLMPAGTPMCAGFYNNGENKKTSGQLHGMFTAMVNPGNGSIGPVHTKAIPDSVIVDFKNEKKSRQGEGLDQALRITRFVPASNGEMFLLGRYDYVEVTVRGTTGALNSYREATYSYAVVLVDATGKIKWEKIKYTSWSNEELGTRYGYPEYMVYGDKTQVFRCGQLDKKAPYGFMSFTLHASGQQEPMTLHTSTPEAEGFSIVENTFRAINNNELVGLAFGTNGRNKNWMHLVKLVNP